MCTMDGSQMRGCCGAAALVSKHSSNLSYRLATYFEADFYSFTTYSCTIVAAEAVNSASGCVVCVKQKVLEICYHAVIQFIDDGWHLEYLCFCVCILLLLFLVVLCVSGTRA